MPGEIDGDYAVIEPERPDLGFENLFAGRISVQENNRRAIACRIQQRYFGMRCRYRVGICSFKNHLTIPHRC